MPFIQQISTGPDTDDRAHPETRPHILLVLDGFPKTLGGGERIVLRLAQHLPHYGYRVSILTFRITADGEFQPHMAPCPIYLLPLTNTYGPQAVAGAFTLRRFLRDQQIQLVETFFESSDIWAGFVAHFLSRAALVWSRRDMGILRTAKHRWAYRALRHCPDAVIAVSERVARHVIEQDGVPADRVHVVHNGLSLDLLPSAPQRSPQLQTTCHVTTIGNIRQVKGHDLLVEAARLVREQHPEVTFSIAGEVLETDFFADLQAQARAAKLDGSFQFLGKITDLPTHLSQVDVFVLPSRSEGFSNALIEAMAMGLPVIATDVGGNGEAVVHGQNGLLIPPEDAGALARALLRLIEDPQLAQSLGQSARKSVEQHFTTEAMMLSVTRVFASAISSKAF